MDEDIKPTDINTTLVVNESISVGYRLYDPLLSWKQNQQVYGDWASKEGRGQNFNVEVELSLMSEASDEIIGSIRTELKSMLAAFDHSFLNDLPSFKDTPPTLENLVLAVESKVSRIRFAQGLDCLRVQVFEDQWWCSKKKNSAKLQLAGEFLAPFVIKKPSGWLPVESMITYVLQGNVDQKTGLLMPRPQFVQRIKLILQKFCAEAVHFEHRSTSDFWALYFKFLEDHWPELQRVEVQDTYTGERLRKDFF